MSYSKIDRSGWKDFFDVFTKAMEGRLLELEIVGRDIGDQRYGVGLNLNGITYDPTDDALYVSIFERHTTSHRSRRPVTSGDPCRDQ